MVKETPVADEQEDAPDEGGFRPRPAWWVDAETRDVQAGEADQRADGRDQLASERDRVASEREVAASGREQDAADMAVRAHQRYDRQGENSVGPLVTAERMLKEEESFARIRVILASRPELADLFDQVQAQVEELYVALVEAGVQADGSRADLLVVAQLLASAAGDRRSAAQDRAKAGEDRLAAHHDRDTARSLRQESAIDRAPRSADSQ
jgi:hypothetical protein